MNIYFCKFFWYSSEKYAKFNFCIDKFACAVSWQPGTCAEDPSDRLSPYCAEDPSDKLSPYLLLSQCLMLAKCLNCESRCDMISFSRCVVKTDDKPWLLAVDVTDNSYQLNKCLNIADCRKQSSHQVTDDSRASNWSLYEVGGNIGKHQALSPDQLFVDSKNNGLLTLSVSWPDACKALQSFLFPQAECFLSFSALTLLFRHGVLIPCL